MVANCISKLQRRTKKGQRQLLFTAKTCDGDNQQAQGRNEDPGHRFLILCLDVLTKWGVFVFRDLADGIRFLSVVVL